MAKVPSNLYYTETHEWIRHEGEKVVIGITEYAQSKLGDVVFVELPSTGDDIESGAPVATVESVKGVSEIYAPVEGSVWELNDELEDVPELINEDPYGQGWILSLRITDESALDDLLTAEEYQALLEEEA
jgi:glycine cleavage system H protein